MLRFASCMLVLLTTAAGADETLRSVRVQTVQFVPEQAVVTYPGTMQARARPALAFVLAVRSPNAWWISATGSWRVSRWRDSIRSTHDSA